MEIAWDQLRAEEFPVTERWAYFDHAAVSPLPRRAGAALRAWAEDVERNGLVHWPTWGEKLEAGRRRAARLMNASVDEVAFVNSTTHGIGLIAEGFPWRDGDNVVVPAEEYPSNIYPWMNLKSRGVETRFVPSRDGRIWSEDLVEAMDGRTRLLSVSHVEFSSGFRNDLDRLGSLCRERGIAFFVDAIQGLGPLLIDVNETPIDFLAADGHKWLLGPEGAGLLYVRRDWIDRLRPIGVGWHSVIGSFDAPDINFELKPTAQRWEGGSFTMPGLQALSASLELFEELGPRAISERILDRAQAVRELAESAGWRVHGSQRPEDLSGIVSLTHDEIPAKPAAAALRERGVVTSARRGRLRVSAHFYNDADDLDRLKQGLIFCRGLV